jgi:hypothetical protein
VPAIRPLERDDLPAVARLYERVMRSGSRSPPPGLVPYFERTLFEYPWYDPEFPPLVYTDGEGRVVGFLGAYSRRLRFEGRPIRMVCSGQLVADPDARVPGVGALLLRKCLAGTQELTITDGATDKVRKLWEGLGGRALSAASTDWIRPLRPWGLTAEVLGRRTRSDRLRRGARTLAPALDGATARLTSRLRPTRPDTITEALTPGAMAELVGALPAEIAVRPDYDEEFLGWLFEALRGVPERGTPVERLVRHPDGRPAGWYVAYIQPEGISRALQLAAESESLGVVLDQLVWEAAQSGSTAVRGRVEPLLLPLLRDRRCFLHPSEWALVHARDPRLLGALAFGRALLTRLEGEWWMGHHVIGGQRGLP